MKIAFLLKDLAEVEMGVCVGRIKTDGFFELDDGTI